MNVYKEKVIPHGDSIMRADGSIRRKTIFEVEQQNKELSLRKRLSIKNISP